jgi:hypothetical protein
MRMSHIDRVNGFPFSWISSGSSLARVSEQATRLPTLQTFTPVIDNA